MFHKTLLIERRQLHTNNRLNNQFTTIQWTEWKKSWKELFWKVDKWEIETRGEAERICGIKWADQRAPRAAVQSSHGLSHEVPYNVTVCVSAWETILGTKCWQTRAAMLVKVPLLWGGLRQCQWVQSSGANSRDDANWLDLIRSFVRYKIWHVTFPHHKVWKLTKPLLY